MRRNKIRIDYSPYSCLAICPCGWRVAVFGRRAAWKLAAEHSLDAHGDRTEYERAHKALYALGKNAKVEQPA